MKNKGIIEVSSTMLIDHSRELLTAMADVGFIPLSIVNLYETDSYEIIGLCDKFSEVKEGDELPFYTIEFSWHSGGVSHRLIKLDDRRD